MMRKYFLFIVSLVLLQCTMGQSTYGIKAGLNLSDQRKEFSTPENINKQLQKTKPLLGYQFGVFGKVGISSTLTIAAEANFSLIGSKTYYLTEDQILNPDGKDHYYNDKLGYIEIPLILQYNINKLYFGLGPGIGIKVFSKITNFENSTYSTPFYKTMDAAGNLLTGYRFTKKIDVNVRYSYGLLNVHEDNNYINVKNRFLNVSLLYSLK